MVKRKSVGFVLLVMGLGFMLSACRSSSSDDELLIQQQQLQANNPANAQRVEEVTPEQQKQKDQLAASYNVQLGMGYMQQGDMTMAKRKLLNALKLNPDSAVALDGMGFYLERTGNPQEAEKYFKQAISKDDGGGLALNNYGTFLCGQKRYQESEKYFLKAVNDPKYTDVAGAYENAGLCALMIPNLANAQQYFTKALLNDPNRISSLYGLADVNYQQGKYQEADQFLKRYLAKAPPSPDVLLLGVQIAQKLGEKAQAASYATLLRDKFPNSKEYQTYKSGQG